MSSTVHQADPGDFSLNIAHVNTQYQFPTRATDERMKKTFKIFAASATYHECEGRTTPDTDKNKASGSNPSCDRMMVAVSRKRYR
jgi:hypothetical protein